MLGFLGIFWMSFLIGFSGALVPGTVLTVTIKETGRRGAWAGPLVTFGHGITEIAITIALILGLSTFLNDPRVKIAVAIVGGAFLIFMGASMLVKIRSLEEELSPERGGKRTGRGTPVLLGMTTTLSNPYWFGWWGSVGASMLVASSSLGLSYNRGLWYKIIFTVCGCFLVVVGG